MRKRYKIIIAIGGWGLGIYLAGLIPLPGIALVLIFFAGMLAGIGGLRWILSY